MKLQKLGGYASLVLSCFFIAMVGILATVFSGIEGLDVYDPTKMIAIYHASTVSFWTYYVLSILTGILTLLVALALQERMQAIAPNLMRLAVIAVSIFFALALSAEMSGIYRNVLVAQINDSSSIRVFLVIHECLYFAGISSLGWGLLLIGCAALRTGALPKTLGYIILAYGLFSHPRSFQERMVRDSRNKLPSVASSERPGSPQLLTNRAYVNLGLRICPFMELLSSCPQEEQHRHSGRFSAEHFGHWII